MQILDNFSSIERYKWAQFVLNHPQGNIFQTPEMYEIFEKTKNYYPLIISLKSKGKIAGIFLSVIQKEYPALGILTSRSIVWGGPLVIPENPKLVTLLLNEYKSQIGGKALYTQIRNLYDTNNLQIDLESQGFKFSDHLNYILDIEAGEEYVWKSMNKKRRNTIKKAIKSDLKIIEVDNLEEITYSYNILEKVYNNARLPLADFSLFKNSFEILGPKRMIKCFSAIFDGKSIGTLWILTYNGRIYDWYSGSLNEYLNKCPNDLLIWHAIKWGINAKFKSFDFGGAGKPDVPYGVRDFKKKFGGVETNFGRFEKSHSPILHSMLQTSFKVFNKI